MKAVDHADCRDQQTISEGIPTKKSQNLELNTRISQAKHIFSIIIAEVEQDDKLTPN
jgi:hypothetical protein